MGHRLRVRQECGMILPVARRIVPGGIRTHP
jgi:hypothetical protein